MGADILQASLMHGDRVNGLAVSASGERIERRGSAVLKAYSGVTKKFVATWQLRRTELQLLLGVIALSAVYSFLYPASFPTLANVLEMSRVGGILFVAAMAQSFALIVGGFDISVAANMGFVSIVSALYMAEGGSVVIGVILGLLGGTGVGLTNGILIGRLGVTPFVATLGSLTFLYGLSDQLSDGGSVAGLPTALSWLGRSDWGPIPSTVAIACIAFVLAWAILARSRAGLYIFSIGGSRETARVSGIPVVRYEVLAYTLCGFFTADCRRHAHRPRFRGTGFTWTRIRASIGSNGSDRWCRDRRRRWSPLGRVPRRRFADRAYHGPRYRRHQSICSADGDGPRPDWRGSDRSHARGQGRSPEQAFPTAEVRQCGPGDVGWR